MSLVELSGCVVGMVPRARRPGADIAWFGTGRFDLKVSCQLVLKGLNAAANA